MESIESFVPKFQRSGKGKYWDGQAKRFEYKLHLCLLRSTGGWGKGAIKCDDFIRPENSWIGL